MSHSFAIVKIITKREDCCHKGDKLRACYKNRKEVVAMVDTQATHNFVANRMVGALGFRVKGCPR